MRIQATIATLLFLLGSADAAEPASCNASRVDSTSAAWELRDIKSSCGSETAAHAAAEQRLNNLEIPLQDIPQVIQRHQIAGAPASRVVYEADVFFYFFEAYPPDIGLQKLADLVDRINTGFATERIEVIGFTDPVENSESLANQRADFLRRYFIAAGLEPNLITIRVGKPRHENTLEGRARDRSASLRVVMLQQPDGNRSAEDFGTKNEIKQLRAERANLQRRIKASLRQIDEGRPVNTDQSAVLEDKRAKLAQWLQEIELEIAQEDGPNAQPTSKAAEVAYLAYHERLLQRIEKAGTEDFPKKDGVNLHGIVKVQFTVAANGSLKRVKIISSSGLPELDRYSTRLLRRLEPFENFPAEMSQLADRIVFDERFNFERGRK